MRRILLSAAAAMCLLGSTAARAQVDHYVAQIITTAATFCPVGYVATEGQTLPITGNTALFSLLGTNYGGDGIHNFGIPNVKPVLTANRFALTTCMATTGIFPARS